MKRVGIALLILAVLFVALPAFGSVNQFEIETGLTVDALMLPTVEKTVDVTLGTLVNTETYASDAVVVTNQIETAELNVVSSIGTSLKAREINPVMVYALGGVAVRLIYPPLPQSG